MGMRVLPVSSRLCRRGGAGCGLSLEMSWDGADWSSSLLVPQQARQH